MRRIAVCPGSFDPVTLGHLDIITRASKRFDKVIVLISRNAGKAQPSFTATERMLMIEAVTHDLDNVVIDILDGLLADYVRNVGAIAIVKGLRAVSDFEYEFQMALANKKLYADAETVFLTTTAENMYLSSSVVKQIAYFGGDISHFVPECILEDIKQRLVKEGKLKKSALKDSVIFRGDENKYYEQIGKHCEDITEEIPFELPASWNWTRGKIVFMPMESTKPTSDFIYIDVDAVNNKLNIIDNAKQMSIDNAPSRATRKLHQNDILFSMVRPYLRNIALVDDTYKSAIASTGFYVITPGIVYFPKFLFYLMLSNYVVDGLNTFMKGDNSPSINNSHIENYLYPLPPFKEQQRIVAQIEKLFEQLL